VLARLLRRRRQPPRALVAAAIALVVVVAAAGLDGALAVGRVRHGVSVGGVDLSGLTPAQARARLLAAAAVLQRRELTIRAGSVSLHRTVTESGIGLDIDASLNAALGAGRHGPFDVQRLRGWLGGVRLPWRLRVDAAKVAGLLDALDRQLGRRSREPALRVDTSLPTAPTVTLAPGHAGVAVDPLGALRSLQAAVAAGQATEVRLPLTRHAPSVPDAAAQAALRQARALLAGPITVTASRGSSAAGPAEAVLRPAELAPLLRAQAAGGELRLALDQDGLDTLLRRKLPAAYHAARDATFAVSGASVHVVPAVPGQAVDPAKAAAALLATGTQPGGARQVTLTSVAQQPTLTTRAAQALGVTEVISSFTTTFSAADAPRVHNIGLIAAAVNGSLVRPGQVFSMNAATGERTAAKGYRTAHVIVNGELVDGLGGGVCQAGTTMFNAVLLAGLPVLQRRNHSLHISHYPLGRDATLNWPDTDLKFHNDSPYGIYISARWSASSLTFTLWSTSRHYQVSLATSPERNFRDPPTTFQDDPSLPVGQQRTTATGSAGFDVTVTRTVTQGGRLVRRDQFVSHYDPWPTIISRGTGQPAPTTTAPAPA
jgi:vancomycin resistance protein YoaR